MKKHLKFLLSLTLCLFVFNMTGCTSSNDAKKIYQDTITKMNTNIHYYQGTAKEYNGDTLYMTTQMEQLRDKDNKLHYISKSTLAKDINIGEITVMDGTNVHKLQYDKNTNTNTYTVNKVAWENSDLSLFLNIFEGTVHIPLKTSSVHQTEKGKKLNFVFTDEKNSDEPLPKTEYTITIENDKIVEMEKISYGTGTDEVTMRSITTYGRFNAHTLIDTKSVINEIQVYK